jgi:hypothetical protein
LSASLAPPVIGLPAVALLALSVVLCLGCGELAAAAPPTVRDLLLADAQAPPGKVPGLNGLTPPFDHPRGSKPVVPSSRACVDTWNSTAPRKTVRWIAARGTGDAVVTLFELEEGTIGDNSPPRVYWDCAFGIVVGPRQLVGRLAASDDLT